MPRDRRADVHGNAAWEICSSGMQHTDHLHSQHPGIWRMARQRGGPGKAQRAKQYHLVADGGSSLHEILDTGRIQAVNVPASGGLDEFLARLLFGNGLAVYTERVPPTPQRE